MKPIVMIPARMASTRFPGKPLVNFRGKPILQRVWERAKSMGFSTYIVTPDKEISDLANRIGAEFISATAPCNNGTERCYFASLYLACPMNQVVINVQGDQLLFDPCRAAWPSYYGPPFNGVASFYSPLYDHNDPGIVKVTIDQDHDALYFSRHPITCQAAHVGIYVYEVGALSFYIRQGLVPLETVENLEQMRWLWMKRTIRMYSHPTAAFSINTPDDLKKAEELWKILKLPD